MYDTVNGNVPSYLSNLFSNVCENNPYKSMLRNTEYNVVLDHVPKTEYNKGSFSIIRGLSLSSIQRRNAMEFITKWHKSVRI